MGGIFISYRRDDSGPYAGRLRDALGHHFGAEQVFRDIDRIDPGERFPRVIEQEVGSCDALLALIGPTWLSINDDAGHRRLDNPEDYVRLEIAAALGRADVLVIPVLFGPTSMPAAADLPNPLASLAECNALRITEESWDGQLERLTRALEKVVKPRVVAPVPLPVAEPRAVVSTAVKVGAGDAKPIAGWLGRKMRHDTSRAALTSYADSLADAINRRETVLLDQLRGGPDTVIDNLQFSAEHRLRLTAGDVAADIGSYFRRQETRRMVVSGAPGAGKTVLAIRLLLDQLHHRATLGDGTRASEPVPVRINASGWDGSADFTTWLSHQLSIDHGLNSRIARAMVDSDLILPVLDGLDEMDPPDAEPDRARVALDRLNEPPWSHRTVVVMCRTGVYDRLRELRGDAGLHGATTITLEPLSSIQIRDYLHHYREQLGIPDEAWAPVTKELAEKPGGPLATALSTPWLLGLAVTSLRRDRRTATQLAVCRDTTEISDLLFAALIPAAIHGTRRTGRTGDYTEQKVQTWMHTLAQHLENRRAQGIGGTEITLDQVWTLAGTRRCRALHALAVGLAFGLVYVLVFGLVWSMPDLSDVVKWGLAVGLAAALCVGLAGSATPPKRFALRVPGRSRWRNALAMGLSFGLSSGLGMGFSPWGGRGVHGLAVGLGMGLAVGLVAGLRTNSEDRLALGQDAKRVIHDDLVAALAYGLMWGLGIGLPLVLTPLLVELHKRGVPLGRLLTDGPALVATLEAALMAALPFGLLAALLASRAAGRHATASLLFAFTETFPPRPAQFLEWARNAGLLRVTGIAYQCRHDSYQQWLAAGDVDRGVKTTSDAQAD